MANVGKRSHDGKWRIRHHFKSGDIGYLAYLHGILYAKEYEYDLTFEAYVACGLGEFVQSFNPNKDRIWLVETDDRVIASLAIVEHSKLEAQLRWFLVHPDYRGLGIGKELLSEAIQFCKERKCKMIFLWTISELVAAGHLYSSFGFRKTEEKMHEIWGKSVKEERYDLHL